MMTEQLPGERLKDVLGTDTFVGDLLFGEPMKSHTTLRIGGPADIYAMPKDLSSMKSLLQALKEEGLPVMPVGGGSNLLISDEGIEGAVLSTASLNLVEVVEEDTDRVRLLAEAGTPLGRLVNLAKDKGYRGVEGLTGIPGSLGGAVRGNAGSFGSAVEDIVESVTVIDRDGNTFLIRKGDIAFGYRTSGIPDGLIVVSLDIRLQKDDIEHVKKRTNDFHLEKKNKQPIDQFSAGCVFKNPPGSHAGLLIDQAGCKGMKKGGIEVSCLHANFFVNRGNGCAQDYLTLMEDVRDKVMKSFGIQLEPEIKIVGRYGV